MTEMNIILLPCKDKHWLIFPQEIAGRVYPYAPTLMVESASEFVVGSMLVQNEKMPVLDFDFSEEGESEKEEALRILLVSTISGESVHRRYAVISYGDPISLKITEDMLKKEEITHAHPFIAQKVSITGQQDKEILLLDLPYFEQELKMT